MHPIVKRRYDYLIDKIIKELDIMFQLSGDSIHDQIILNGYYVLNGDILIDLHDLTHIANCDELNKLLLNEKIKIEPHADILKPFRIEIID